MHPSAQPKMQPAGGHHGGNSAPPSADYDESGRDLEEGGAPPTQRKCSRRNNSFDKFRNVQNSKTKSLNALATQTPFLTALLNIIVTAFRGKDGETFNNIYK